MLLFQSILLDVCLHEHGASLLWAFHLDAQVYIYTTPRADSPAIMSGDDNRDSIHAGVRRTTSMLKWTSLKRRRLGRVMSWLASHDKTTYIRLYWEGSAKVRMAKILRWRTFYKTCYFHIDHKRERD